MVPEPDDRSAAFVPAGPARATRSVAWAPHDASSRERISDPPGASRDHGYCQVLSRSLIRAQLGLSLLCLAFALAVTVSFPELCALLPGLVAVRIFGLPLTLVVLGAGIFPVILAIGRFYTWQASRLEHRFVTLMDQVSGDDSHLD